MVKRLLKKPYRAHLAWYMLKHLQRTARARLYGASATEFRRRLSPPARNGLEFVVEVEVGVGDSLAMCILWIGFGAKKVWGVDAFADPRDLVHEKAIVESLLRSLPDDQGCRIRAVVDLRGKRCRSIKTDFATSGIPPARDFWM